MSGIFLVGSTITNIFGIIIILWVLWALRPAVRAIRNLQITEVTDEAMQQLYHILGPAVDTFEIPIAVLTAKTMHEAVISHQQMKTITFDKAIEDSTTQMIENFMENRYIRPITLQANLLPPLGFIGTIVGMVIVFSGAAAGSTQINTRGLGVALLSTLYALSGFVTIELVKLWIVKRATRCIRVGIELYNCMQYTLE